MKKIILFSLLLIGCSTKPLDPLLLDAGSTIDASIDVEEPKVCEKLTCNDEFFFYCGVKHNKCGETLDCGTCPHPYKCGAQDLQNYSPTENYCGLGCIVVSTTSVNCKYPFVIEHECDNNKDMVDFLASDKFSQYGCNLIPQGTTNSKLHFCCGL